MSDSADPLDGRIFHIRGHRVILDADLARLYGVPTKRFNEAVKRNASRFPADFAFQLTAQEFAVLRSQFATSSLEPTGNEQSKYNWPQFATSSTSRQHGGRRYNPRAFTEHGALMVANILNSEKALEMSVYVVRAFIKQRETLAANATILKRLAEIDKALIKHDTALQILWKKLQPLLAPPPDPPRRRIGFGQ
ncbi:MAG: ORF6N domain-containing protein [Lacunisphaera sp.]